LKKDVGGEGKGVKNFVGFVGRDNGWRTRRGDIDLRRYGNSERQNEGRDIE